ncbi:DUF1993 domain-containing protein [Hyphococcus luteus]|uniref:DUF1993 domain-containing protein n=1 Tax=Hyphococcus luteus TaxID=2058213 RepID=A0A2S7K1X7_9PROT|nr:DUF1993 domain-containing protein [Marinicaulis flavus]PQA86507.1 DUF1993 domain-containing protein [Marinicaulis flavus]
MTFPISQIAETALGQMFGGLERALKKGAAHAEANKVEESVYLDWRLAPDMFPMKRQVQIATELPARGLARLAGAPLPSFDDKEENFAALLARIDKARDFIKDLDMQAVDRNPDANITVPMGPQEMTFARSAYFLTFVLPNLYFHITAAYLNLRNMGVDVGKLDYMNAQQEA